MSALPGWYATVIACCAAALGLAPLVAAQHRRCGQLHPRACAGAMAVLLYAAGLACYVFWPHPPTGCAAAQWRLLSGLGEAEHARQFAANIALFVPLGVLVRRYRGTRATAVGAGAAVSLLVEHAQLTGFWSLLPCAYRVFDVDDLLTNTCGSALGALAPAAPPRPPPDVRSARSATPGRRVLGMACDLTLLLSASAISAAVLTGGHSPGWRRAGACWFIPALLALAVLLAGRGTSLGQRAVLLGAAPTPHPLRSCVLRWGCGCGGLAAALGCAELRDAADGAPAAALVAVYCLLHGGAAFTGGDVRGISGRLAGLHFSDLRTAGRSTPAPT
ncbi:VanZ family protein [Saccharopolyspora sp. HNM0983]|uniref:VanZ family protein n=1 Tax=Saccharopolyspora montiporae TaxID=2781240 RepID=A0A929B6Z9_9PSEU|nr:VanZ family protein [Saccharopolyspora sp. HNM0983]MBE9374344.1 VanZ family protein [Saccharopolyspora sp. HNM0983]